ncbi:MAG: hypothetical protein AAF485_12930 [Chloroflexota bacterium]
MNRQHLRLVKSAAQSSKKRYQKPCLQPITQAEAIQWQNQASTQIAQKVMLYQIMAEIEAIEPISSAA